MYKSSNNYKQLRFFENQLRQYFTRYEKEFFFDEDMETQYDYKVRMLSHINDITIPNCVLKDIIQMICDIGNIDSNVLIEEINLNNFRINQIEGKIKFNYILSIDDICEFIKNKMDNIYILTEPLNGLFSWYRSIKGIAFYRKLNRELQKHFMLYEIIE